MIALIILLTILVETAKCKTISVHGSADGIKHTIVCPYNGDITGITVRYGYLIVHRLYEISFICTSSMGTTTFGPYGASSDEELNPYYCSEGQYVSSIFGSISRSSTLNTIGIRCRSQDDLKLKGVGYSIPDPGFHIENSTYFDDKDYSIGARPISVSVYVNRYMYSKSYISAIEITYENTTTVTNQQCNDCSQYKEEWAPMHGLQYKTAYEIKYGTTVRYFEADMYSFVCPNEGVITGITYFSDFLHFQNLHFKCSSPFGETKFGPYPSNPKRTDFDNDKSCPPNTYIGSIYGMSGDFVHQLGIRCVSYEQPDITSQQYVYGGTARGEPFDDAMYAIRGQRPVEIKVWGKDGMVAAIQIKYGNMPVAYHCRVTKLEVTDPNIDAKLDGIEVIGINAGSSCSSMQQQLTLQATQTVEESVSIEKMDGGEFNWAAEVSVSATVETGVIFAKASVTAGLSVGIGGSKSWSTTNTTQITTGTEKSQGYVMNFQGPGAAIAIGYLNRYKISRDNISARYHFSCNGHNWASQPGKIRLTGTVFGKANYRDYQFKFNNKEECTPEARSCVDNIEPGNIFNITSLETKFNACFLPNSGVYSPR